MDLDLPPPNDLLPRPLRRALAPLARFLWRPRSRYVLAWLFALAVTAAFVYVSRHCFDRPGRGDGNAGHVYIDFGGQWLMGRMLVEGHGRHLYDLRYQRRVLRDHYPVADQDPKQKESDVDELFGSFMGTGTYKEAAQTVAALLTPLAAPDAAGAAALLAAGQQHCPPGRLPVPTAAQAGRPL